MALNVLSGHLQADEARVPELAALHEQSEVLTPLGPEKHVSAESALHAGTVVWMMRHYNTSKRRRTFPETLPGDRESMSQGLQSAGLP